jgi:hypothetical protein
MRALGDLAKVLYMETEETLTLGRVNNMQTLYKTLTLMTALILCATTLSVFAVPVDSLVWGTQVDSATGATVTSPPLDVGKEYRIVAQGTWLYNEPSNLAADAQYYTTNFTNSVYWGIYSAAPGGHSFLQINNLDVNWGPFSDGETGHTYTIYYTGNGSPITFRIVDWVDSNTANNFCHITVRIFQETIVGGTVIDNYKTDAAPYVAIGLLIIAAVILTPMINVRKASEKKP